MFNELVDKCLTVHFFYMIKLRYFTPQEFINANPSCSIDDMDEDFMLKLDSARDIAGVPFIVSSAFRTVEYEHEQGRHFDNIGAHSTYPCKAVDLLCYTSGERFKIVHALVVVGFVRIGIYHGFIHVDDDDTKKMPCLFLGV